MSDQMVIGTIRRAVQIAVYPAGSDSETDAPSEVREHEWFFERDGVTWITDPERIAAIRARQAQTETAS